MNPDGSDMEVYAMGVRNSVGFTWHPETGEMWFTDNGRDNLGDDIPPCELNHAPEKGMHFGFPYIHGGDIPDPEFGDGHSASNYTVPAQNLGPHVAPLGLEFYHGENFPDMYRNQILIAEHGSSESRRENWLQDIYGSRWMRPVTVQDTLHSSTGGSRDKKHGDGQ